MADLANTYYFGTSASEPVIQYRISYTSTRTGVNDVSTNVKITVFPLKSSASYFGYNITARAEIGGVSGGTITVKGTSPRYWGSEFTVDLGTINNSGVDAMTTALPATVYVSSNSGRSSDTGGQTVSFPVGNTNAYWTSSKYCNVSPSGIIPENTSTLNVSWGGARDDQGNTIYYATEFWANGTLTGYAGSSPTTATSGSVNISSYSPGSTFYFRTHCRDEYSSVWNFGVQSSTVTKNQLTPARLSAGSSISFDSSSFYLTRNNASNTNGNTSFTYNLTCAGINVYNGNVSSLGTRITVSIYRSGTVPSGPYIKFSELQSYVAATDYNRQLMFTLSTTNAYGSYRISSCYVQANLQELPTTPSSLSVSGHYTVNSQNYYVINRRGITFSWDASTEPNNSSPIYYDVEMSIDGGEWKRYGTGLISTSYTTPVMSRTSSGKLQFRVRARTVYETTSDWLTSDELSIHYYYPPTLDNLSVDRSDTSQTSSGSIKQYTSIPDITYNMTVQYKRGPSKIGSQTFTMTDSYNFSYTQTGLSEEETFVETIAVSDDISTSVFGMSSPQSTGSVAVPRYTSLLTIREKGVGINAVAGDHASFAVLGPVTIHGGTHDNGSIDISTHSDAYISVWSGAYMDSEGVLRAAQDIEVCEYFTQVQFYNNTASAPVRYRNWCLMSAAAKNTPISPVYSEWISLATTHDVRSAINDYPSYGSWIPEMGNCTFSYVKCTYYKIGKLCHISGTWKFDSYDDCSTQVTGFPFSPADSFELLPCRITDSSRGIYGSCEQILTIYMRTNGQFVYQHKSGNVFTIPCDIMSDGCTVSVNGVYRTQL